MTAEERMKIGFRLRDVRMQREITIRDLAMQTELGERQISDMEHGNSNRLDVLFGMIQALDVSADYIIMGSQVMIAGSGLVLRSDNEVKSEIQVK